MSKSQHGTAFSTKLGTVITAIITAVCTAVKDFSIADIIESFDNQGEKLTQHLRLVLTAMITKKNLVLEDIQVQATKLLEVISSINVTAVTKFVARDHFKVGNSDGVKFSYIGENFQKKFLPKIEENIAAAIIRVYKLLVGLLDPEIMTALGPNRQISLAHLWEMLKLQPNGEVGALLTDGNWNIFYIPDIDGNLWAVYVRWYGAGWIVRAYSVDYPSRWDAGYRVFGC
jgi:hypothetical protein